MREHFSKLVGLERLDPVTRRPANGWVAFISENAANTIYAYQWNDNLQGNFIRKDPGTRIVADRSRDRPRVGQSKVWPDAGRDKTLCCLEMVMGKERREKRELGDTKRGRTNGHHIDRSTVGSPLSVKKR